MKQFFLICTTLLVCACSTKKAPDTAVQVEPKQAVASLNPQAFKFYGDSIAITNAIPMDSLAKMMQPGKELEATVVGEITSTCQTKGCWMKVKGSGEDAPMQVMTKDHAFFLPIADFKSKKVVFKGVAFYDTTSVDDLKEYASDEKMPAEEIAKITEPKVELSFIAEGIAVEKAANEINKVQ